MTIRAKVLFTSVVLSSVAVAVYGLATIIWQLPIALPLRAVSLLGSAWLTMGVLSMAVFDINGGLTRPGDADPARWSITNRVIVVLFGPFYLIWIVRYA